MTTSTAITSAMENPLIAWSALLLMIRDRDIGNLKCQRKRQKKNRNLV